MPCIDKNKCNLKSSSIKTKTTELNNNNKLSLLELSPSFFTCIGTGSVIAHRKNPSKRGAGNAGHRPLDRSDSSTTTAARGMQCVTINCTRITSQAVESLLDARQIRARSEVSARGGRVYKLALSVNQGGSSRRSPVECPLLSMSFSFNLLPANVAASEN